MRFDPTKLGDDLDAYFAAEEATFTDILPGCHKRVDWAGDAGAQTNWSILYVHGFSATSEEIRPVTDKLATGLGGANVVYTRLQGHGRGGDAMADGTADGWLHDFEEGLAVAKRVGRRVMIVTTSTGGTIAAHAAQDPGLMQDVGGIVFVAPNFAINNPAAFLLTLPGARIWGPWVAGKRRTFEVRNEAHGRFWATDYPTISVIPVATLVRKVATQDPSRCAVPALFMFCDEDQVVKATATRRVIARWGGPNHVVNPHLSDGDDEYAHVIAGDVLSPGQTEFAATAMIDWAKEL